MAEVEKSTLPAEQKFNVLHELKVKQQQFNVALVASLGISVEADVVPAAQPGGAFAEMRGAQQSFQMATPGRSFHVGVHLFDGGKLPVEIESVALTASSGKQWTITADAAAPKQIEPGKAADVRFAAKVPDDEPYTRPYFTRPDMEQPYYDIANKAMIDMPTGSVPARGDCALSVSRV